MQNWLEVGKIVRSHGIKGAVKIVSYLDGVNFCLLKNLYIGTKRLKSEVVSCSPLNNNSFTVLLSNIKSVEEADKLKNQIVFIDRNEYSQFEDKVYLSDLIGSSVLDEKGNPIGELIDFNEYGASTVLEIKCGAVTYSLPYVEDVVWYDESTKALTTTQKIFKDLRV